MKLHTGDQVLITAGRDKGQKGKIERVLQKIDRVVVAGLNIYKKNRKPFAGQKGGVIEFARPLPVANIALVCPNCSKQTRIAYNIDKKGEKTRICVKCKQVITVST